MHRFVAQIELEEMRAMLFVIVQNEEWGIPNILIVDTIWVESMNDHE